MECGDTSPLFSSEGRDPSVARRLSRAQPQSLPSRRPLDTSLFTLPATLPASLPAIGHGFPRKPPGPTGRRGLRLDATAHSSWKSRHSTSDGAAVQGKPLTMSGATRAVVPAPTQSGVVATALPQRAAALARWLSAEPAGNGPVVVDAPAAHRLGRRVRWAAGGGLTRR